MCLHVLSSVTGRVQHTIQLVMQVNILELQVEGCSNLRPLLNTHMRGISNLSWKEATQYNLGSAGESFCIVAKCPDLSGTLTIYRLLSLSCPTGCFVKGLSR